MCVHNHSVVLNLSIGLTWKLLQGSVVCRSHVSPPGKYIPAAPAGYFTVKSQVHSLGVELQLFTELQSSIQNSIYIFTHLNLDSEK